MDQASLIQHLSTILERTRHGTGDSDRHLLVLFAAALGSEGKTYLELGVRDGTTTLPLLLAAHLNGGTLLSVDAQDTTFVCPPELARHWRFVKSDALAFLKAWDVSRPLDFVFVDDWHAYAHVRQELQYLRDLTGPSSVILLHDLMYAGTEPRYHTDRAAREGEWAHGGPFRAVAELGPAQWEWATLPWNNGLTLLRRKGGVVVTRERHFQRSLRWLWRRAGGVRRRLGSLF